MFSIHNYRNQLWKTTFWNTLLYSLNILNFAFQVFATLYSIYQICLCEKYAKFNAGVGKFGYLDLSFISDCLHVRTASCMYTEDEANGQIDRAQL